jgi:hypothetical protein
MKWIKTFESHRNSEKVNEEFIGKLFQGLKNKLSLGFSKMFGNAADADKVILEYKKEILQAQAKKKEALKAFGDYFKSVQDGGEKDQNKINELKKNLDLSTKNYDEQVKLIKQKFDIKFKDVIDDEDNKKIQNYIQLKKIEMQQELLAEENKALLADGGLKLEDIKDPQFKKMIEEINKKMQDSQKMVEEQKNILEKKEEAGAESFNFEEAKKNSLNYKWENSKYAKDYKFVAGEEIKAWMNESGNEDLPTFKKDGDEYKGTTLFVASDDKQKENKEQDKIAVTANKDDLNSGFTILKTKIISTKKDEEESAKKSEEEENKQKTEAESTEN